MNVTPELVKKHFWRFYSIFGARTPAHEIDPFLTAIDIWAEIFATWPAESFTQACKQCEQTLQQFPVPADIVNARTTQ